MLTMFIHGWNAQIKECVIAKQVFVNAFLDMRVLLVRELYVHKIAIIEELAGLKNIWLQR